MVVDLASPSIYHTNYHNSWGFDIQSRAGYLSSTVVRSQELLPISPGCIYRWLHKLYFVAGVPRTAENRISTTETALFFRSGCGPHIVLEALGHTREPWFGAPGFSAASV